MSDMGVVETDDKRAEFRQSEPHWHLALEHAGLVVGIASVAARRFAQSLAGDDERSLDATGLRAMQKPQQRRMRLLLRHAVQIEARVDRLPAARPARGATARAPRGRAGRWA